MGKISYIFVQKSKSNIQSTRTSLFFGQNYSIVKDSSAELGVNFKIVQNRPTVKAVCTKISKKNFAYFLHIFIFLRENKEVSFFIF